MSNHPSAQQFAENTDDVNNGNTAMKPTVIVRASYFSSVVRAKESSAKLAQLLMHLQKNGVDVKYNSTRPIEELSHLFKLNGYEYLDINQSNTVQATRLEALKETVKDQRHNTLVIDENAADHSTSLCLCAFRRCCQCTASSHCQ